jgi:flagellar basal-body rod protein FlgF
MQTPSYIALSSEAALSRQMDVVANNLANASTTAFKAQRLVFRQYVVGGGADGATAFVEDATTYRDSRQGPLTQTGNSLDVAIDGPGYFSVTTPDGTRYTRSGHLKLGPEGTLVTDQGYAVQGDGGAPLTLPLGSTNITITKDGTVSSRGGSIGKISLVAFADASQVQSEANGFYVSDATPTPATDATLRQGMIEESNVQPVLELTRLMDVSRNYEAINSMINGENDRIKTAIDKLSKVA